MGDWRSFLEGNMCGTFFLQVRNDISEPADDNSLLSVNKCLFTDLRDIFAQKFQLLRYSILIK